MTVVVCAPSPPAFGKLGKTLTLIAILYAVILTFLPAHAQPPPDYRARAAQLVDVLAAPGREDQLFSPIFLSAVPVAQWRALAAQWRAAHGAPQSLAHVRMESATIGAVEVRYARATLGFQLVIAPRAPHRVIGLRLVGVKRSGDSAGEVMAELNALPGGVALAAMRLTDSGPVPIHVIAPDGQMATGSSFKLYVLAELARATAAGERAWSDVTPLGPKSFSGRLSTYPQGAPMTLHSLALAMIAESDNSASDTLLRALGRDRVDAMLRATGHAAPDAALPLLTTAEAFALKMPAQAALRATYAAATPQARADLIRANADTLTAASIDVGQVAETPTAIDSIEWFAAPMDMVRLLDWLRVRGGEALPIMAVNPGIAPADAARWRYLGYKGGSEPGVIAMNLLGQRQDGEWIALSASWNNPAALVDEGRFVALVTRMLNLLAEAPPPKPRSSEPQSSEPQSSEPRSSKP
ncbi:serine hydrolase [Sphingobium sp. AN641]|uniref:serine hydrolase n=1 Tax=Sphingobium sp. AN641 TaxID=3133443 RepID=UPI0030BE9A2C